ncbi:MAG TPA: DUF5615 family PIN-like protein [Phycisphaerae bacterium]|jgi:hypothetical protein
MPIGFYLDEHVHPALAAGLRRRAIDVLTTVESGMLSVADLQQLTFANEQGRVMVTRDPDFLRLAAAGTPHAGIAFYTPRGRRWIGTVLRGLILIHEVLTEADMQNHIEFL